MAVKGSYRSLGRTHLAQAKTLLDKADDQLLLYAALELRMAIESHIYSTADSYQNELPEQQLTKWQPAALLKELLIIDPHIDREGTLSFSRETEPSVAGDRWRTMGALKHLSLKEIETVYHKLGSYLHLDTVLDRQQNKQRDLSSLRASCDVLVGRLEEVFGTRIYNFKMGVTAQLECFVCGKQIKRRLTTLGKGDKIQTECGSDCYATYEISLKGKKKVNWKALFKDFPCQHESCDGMVEIWEKNLKAGNSFVCEKCNRASEIILSLKPQEAS